MRKLWRDILISFVLGMVLPAACLRAFEKKQEPAPLQETIAINDSRQILFRSSKIQTQRRNLEEYLTGVVLAEMPAYFEPEALKAQAVAARTFAWKAATTGGKHGDGSVCGDYTCCQAYTSVTDFQNRGGTAEAVERVREAVYATADTVLTYDGNLIEAVYFSCSGGRTEDAVAVWGMDYPYLRSTVSPGEENAPYFSEELFYTNAELESLLETDFSDSDGFSNFVYTHGGGVAEVTIGENRWTGTQLRERLHLRSTDFELYPTNDGLRIVTHGYGHRVGMSQYGAEAMAVKGSTFPEILAHYYFGTQLMKIEDLPR